MKKLFLNLSIFNLLVVSNIGLIACNNNVNKNPYDMGETKDFDIKSFSSSDFQMLADAKISNLKTFSDASILEEQIRNKVLDSIFVQIIGSTTNLSNELKALKKFNTQILNFKFELINKNQQLKTVVKIYKWEDVERIFKLVAFPNPTHSLIKGLAELGLNNVKKYYDHIKNNNVEFTIEYGDKSFYSMIETVRKILEEDNKNNIDDYQFYVNLDPLHVRDFISTQIKYRLRQLLKNQSVVNADVVFFKDKNNFKLPNDLIDKAIDVNKIKLEYNQQYQTIVCINDKNHYSEYIPIKFKLKNINLLIEKIKKLDFTHIIPSLNKVSELEYEVREYIRKSFKETEAMQIVVNVLNEQLTNKLEDKEYTLKVNIQSIDFQINWKINLKNLNFK